MKTVTALMLAAVLIPFASHSEEEAVFRVSNWQYGRERKTVTGSNRVTGEFNLKNATKAPVTDLIVTVNYTTGLGESVIAPIVQKVGTLKAGESKPMKFVQEFVPIFQSYSIIMKFNGGKSEEWYSSSDVAQPEVKGALIKGEANVLILGKEAAIDKNGVFKGTIHLKNDGTEDANNLMVFVTFYDLHKKKVKDWSGPLGKGTLAGGADENIAFTVPGAPRNYGGYSIRLNNDEAPPEAALSGGEFTNGSDVEFAHFKFTHGSGSAMKVDAQCRNGLKDAVDHVKLDIVFFDGKRKEVKRFTHQVPGAIAAGEVKDVSFEIPSLPAYQEYEQQITFGKAGMSAPKPTPAPAAVLKFERKPEVEVIFGPIAVNVDKVVEIKGAVRNGKSAPVKDVAIHVIFMKGSTEITTVDRTLNSTLKPGEEKEMTIYSPQAVGATDYIFSFKFTDLGSDEPKTDDKKPEAKKVDVKKPEKSGVDAAL